MPVLLFHMIDARHRSIDKVVQQDVPGLLLFKKKIAAFACSGNFDQETKDVGILFAITEPNSERLSDLWQS
jgi:hypothetical protein